MSDKETNNITQLEEKLKKELQTLGITKDEIKIIEAWRFVRISGNFMIYKREGTISRKININL